MQIKAYNKKELEEYIVSDFFRIQTNIPISFHRAVSQINNPYCSDDDILLWAAYENANLVGYVGVLPDLICLNNVEQKQYWLSCFWVEDEFRNKNLASQLLYLVIKQYRNKLYISNYLFSLDKIYQGLGIFQPTHYLSGKTFYRKLDFSNLLAARFPKIKALIPLYLQVERIANLFFGALDRSVVRKNEVNVRIVENKNFDDEFQYFLSSFKGVDFVRPMKHFKWIINYPWILVGLPDGESEKYYFSSKSVQFEYRSVKLYDVEKLVGYALLKIRNRKLTICYTYVTDDCIEDLGFYILAIAQRENLLSISSFDNRLTAFLNVQKGFVFKKSERRPFIFPKKSEINFSIFQEGDGDSIFT